MEIRHFVTFKKVAELGSFTLAAENLSYTQSSVTAHIQTLEEELGITLFDRIGKKVILTSAGEKLLEYTNSLLNIYNKIENISIDEIRGELKIGAPESLTIYRLSPILRKFNKKLKNVNITLVNSTCNDLKTKLLKGELDIAFLMLPEFNEPDLRILELADEPLVLVGSNELNMDMLNMDEKNKDLDTCVIYNERDCTYSVIFENYLKSKKIKPTSRMELWNIESIKKCIIDNLGISLLPLITVSEEISNNKLKAIKLDSELEIMHSYMAYHKDKWISPAMDQFIKLVLTEADDWKTVSHKNLV